MGKRKLSDLTQLSLCNPNTNQEEAECLRFDTCLFLQCRCFQARSASARSHTRKELRVDGRDQFRARCRLARWYDHLREGLFSSQTCHSSCGLSWMQCSCNSSTHGPTATRTIIDVDVSVRNDDGRAAPTQIVCITFSLHLTFTQARLPLAVGK